MSIKKVSIGLIGMGVVGSAFVRLLEKKRARLAQLTGCRAQVVCALVKHVDAPRDCNLEGIALTDDVEVFFESGIDVVVELMGGVDFAHACFERCLAMQKPVVTANKSLLARNGDFLFPAFAAKQVPIFYEAAVAGAIPIIRLLNTTFSSESITSLTGIINGTTNFILDKMYTSALSFEVALKQAQALGFAEADASFDIEGTDAAHKLAILTRMIAHASNAFEHVRVKGIAHIKLPDLEIAQSAGYAIKHVARLQQKKGVLSLCVEPCLVGKDHMFFGVSGAKNAICLDGEASGEAMFYGEGAGGLPTASAVLSDVHQLLGHLNQKTTSFSQDAPSEEAAADFEFATQAFEGAYGFLVSNEHDLQCAETVKCFEPFGVEVIQFQRTASGYFVRTGITSEQIFLNALNQFSLKHVVLNHLPVI